MQCKKIEYWSFSELVGAFLDLGITYLLLCASSLAYSTSKFLGLLGLSLPCPCNGRFGDPNRKNCWQRALVDRPSEKKSSVQFSVRSRFPFDSIWEDDKSCSSSFNLIDERSCDNGYGGLEVEASNGLYDDTGVGSGVMYTRRFGRKGKGKGVSKHGLSLRRRRKVSAGNGRFSSAASYETVESDARALSQSFVSVSNELGGEDSSKHFDIPEKISNEFELNESIDEDIPSDKGASHFVGLKCKPYGELYSDSDEKNAIRILEKAIEEEHAARAALYVELDKERSAAATAADEAMAMILRLQEEKASIEMNARQYQRMIEEKSAYDSEEMNLLKEILLRREREKHFLEKEVESYRQMILGSEQLDSDVQDVGTTDRKTAPLLLSCEDPVMLQTVGECIGEKRQVTNIETQNHTSASGKEIPIPMLDEVDLSKEGSIYREMLFNKLDQHFSSGNQMDESQEKNFLPRQERELQKIETYPQFNLSTAHGHTLHEKTTSHIAEAQPQSDGISQELASKTIETCDEPKILMTYSCDDPRGTDQEIDSQGAAINICPRDVHVIEDMSTEYRKLSVNAAIDIPQKCDSPILSRLGTELDIKRRYSGATSGLPPMGRSLSDLRRNSTSAVDFERFKIENEVGWLQERLRLIQEGREKLNMSIDNREKEKSQLQLLEDIVSQLREIRLLTEPGKAVRQASLPPSYCKVSKKRRWRSISLGLQRSS